MTSTLMTLMFLVAAADTPQAPMVPPRLISDPPQVTGVAARRDVPRKFQVELTIDLEGMPRDVVVRTGPGAPWDAAVKSAVEATRFAPASRGG